MCLARDEQIRVYVAKSKPALLRLLRYARVKVEAQLIVADKDAYLGCFSF